MQATHEAIANALNEHSKWDAGVKSLIKWQLGMAGDFTEALWTAISKADQKNLARIQKGFPEEVSAFIDWSMGDLARELRESGLDL